MDPIEQVKNMTELEFLSFLEGISDHVKANRWHDAIDTVFSNQLKEQVLEYEEEIDELEDKVSDLKEEMDDLSRTIVEERLTWTKDNLAKKLSEMSPVDYDSLMDKVDREAWNVKGLNPKFQR